MAALQNAHAKPRAIVAAANEVPGFDKVFEADAGNWEGYTLEEHTEKILRNFDENFADRLPVELLAPMRLALVVHDLGKPAAAAQHQKHNQAQYNTEKASQFVNVLGIDANVKQFTLGLIGPGMELTTQTAVFGRDEQLQPMRVFAREALGSLVGVTLVNQ